MLGEALIDLHGVDGNAAGLGLLPLTTLFAPDKTVLPASVQLPPLPGALAPLSGVQAQVYEIHHGQTSVRPDRKSTRLNSSHSQISYAVFCLKKKNAGAERRAH